MERTEFPELRPAGRQDESFPTSVRPIGTGAQAGTFSLESNDNFSAEEKRKAPVEGQVGRIPSDIIEHMVG